MIQIISMQQWLVLRSHQEAETSYDADQFRQHSGKDNPLSLDA
jgi:hypothetical protein